MRCGCANISFALKRVGICNRGGGLTQIKAPLPLRERSFFCRKTALLKKYFSEIADCGQQTRYSSDDCAVSKRERFFYVSS